jgi:DNA-binding transcriptional MerR regulator
MTVQQHQIVLHDTDSQRLTMDDLCVHVGLHPTLVERFVEFGLITPMRQEAVLFFDPSSVTRLRTIVRLRQHLGINLAGVSVVLDLVDKISALQRENESLRTAAHKADEIESR